MSLPASVADPLDEGHRARKQAATRERIVKAAIALALEHGYENTTIEMICEASMVSQRTFFNYFGTKETVVLGTLPEIPDPGELDDYVHGTGSVLGDLVETLGSILATKRPDTDVFHDRRLLIQRTPELANAEMARMLEMQDRLTALVVARYRAQGRRVSRSLDDEARMVVALATGVIHHVMQTWRLSDFTKNPRDLLRESIHLVERVTAADENTHTARDTR